MLIIPDPATAFMDPFGETPTLVMLATSWTRSPGSITTAIRAGSRKKAELYLKNSGMADTAYLRRGSRVFHLRQHSVRPEPARGFYFIDAEEGRWNSGRAENNLGYRPRYKEGYFPVPPTDHYQDLRSEMVQTMIECGLNIECHHHEVATGGQCEIDQRFDTLVKSADNMMLYKYIVRNVANQYGKTVTFMPKPLFGDNGSGMHTHQSLWKDGKPLFAGDGYAGLSQMALWYIGGLLKHARALSAIIAPTTNSYKPGARLRGSCEPGLLAAQPLGRLPHSDVLGEPEIEARRVPAAGSVVQPVPGVCGDDDGGSGWRREQDRSG